jgi:IclR family KDG regulon transcriptional repressor
LADIQSLARGLQFLEILSEADQEGVRITELAEQLQIDKGTASRLAQTLAHYGYAERDEVTHRYRLGARVVHLSRSVIRRTPLRETAKPFLHELVERTGECAHLGVPAQGKVLYLDQEQSPATLRVNADIGMLAPLHCTALGKALLAFGGAKLPEALSVHTARTITDAEMLRINLEITRKQGYAVDDEEFDYGVRCIAVPVYDFREKVIGAMGISGPAGRITLERIPTLAQIVVEVGQALTDRMSFKQEGET